MLICKVDLPWHRIWIEVLLGVCLAEELHAEYGEDVDDNDEEEGLELKYFFDDCTKKQANFINKILLLRFMKWSSFL